MENEKIKLKIGDLQNKVRELSSKIEDNGKMFTMVLETEKRVRESIKKEISNFFEQSKGLIHNTVSNIIDETYKEGFERNMQMNVDKMNNNIKFQTKSFNKSVEDLLKEMGNLKKDNDFLMSILCNKLSITSEEFKKLAKFFDKNYPKDRVNNLYEMFKMRVQDISKIKELIGED